VLGFLVATVEMFGSSLAGTHMLLKQDLAAGRLTRAELRAARRDLRERRRRGSARLRGGIRAYLRRDFHPNQVDDLARAHQRLAGLLPGVA
jgi:predicted metal-dependent hydrolase